MAQGRPEHIQQTINELEDRHTIIIKTIQFLEMIYPLPTVTPKIDDTPKQSRQTKRTRRRSGNLVETDLPKGVSLARTTKSGEKRYSAYVWDKTKKKITHLGQAYTTPDAAAAAIEKYKAEQDQNIKTKHWMCTHCKETVQLPVKPVVCLHCRGASFDEVIGKSGD